MQPEQTAKVSLVCLPSLSLSLMISWVSFTSMIL